MGFFIMRTGYPQRCWSGSISGVGAACSLVHARNFAGDMGRIGSDGTWRVDRQSPLIDKANIQIQRNGVGSPSTIACVLVPNHLAAQADTEARAAELTHAIHRALSESVGSRYDRGGGRGMVIEAYEISGGFSS